MEIDKVNFLLTKEIQRKFCTYDLVPSNLHVCYNCMPKKSIIENKVSL